MAKNIPQQVSMTNLQELLTGLEKIFNTTGNRIVAVNLFNSFSQREDMSVQDLLHWHGTTVLLGISWC